MTFVLSVKAAYRCIKTWVNPTETLPPWSSVIPAQIVSNQEWFDTLNILLAWWSFCQVRIIMTRTENWVPVMAGYLDFFNPWIFLYCHCVYFQEGWFRVRLKKTLFSTYGEVIDKFLNFLGPQILCKLE